jgi:hypothetical protein
MSTKNVLPALLAICLITFTADAQRGGGHAGGGGGGHAGGGGGGHVSAGGGGGHASAGGGGMRSGGGFSAPAARSGGYSTQGFRGGVGGGARVVAPRGGYPRGGTYPHRGYANRGYGYGRGYGLGLYGGYYPGDYGCYSYYDCYGTPSVDYGYAAPAIADPVPDYYPQQYAAPPPPQQSYYAAPPPTPPTPTTLTLLAFKDRTIQVATAYSFDRGFIVYVNETGVRKSVPADQLDFDTTRKLNTDRGVPFDPH